MEKKRDKTKIIIGDKGLAHYFMVATLTLETHKTVTLSATGNHINEMERISRLIRDRSRQPVVEAKRFSEEINEGIYARLCVLKEEE